jgi:plasmid stability protein
MRNITLSIDDDLLEKGREYARSHNISLNALVRKLLKQAVVREEGNWLDDMFKLMDRANVSSEGKRWTRDELYRV